MEIRVYRNGETKRLELRNTAAKNDQQFIDLNEFRDITVSIVGEQISIKRKSELIVRSDPSNFKDKNGGSLGNSPRIVADKIEAIISNRKEVDSFVIGSDLSEKSSETIFTHNKAGTDGLGGRMVVTEENAKLDVTRSSGQGVSCFEVDVATVTGYDRGKLLGKAAWSNLTRNVFTGEAFSGQTLDSMFTVHDLFQVEGESQFVGTVNFNGDIEVNGSALDITDLASVPSSLGTSGQVLAVNSAGTSLEFVNQSGGSGGSGSSTLLGLTDTPSGFGSSGQVLVVNSGRTAMEFATPLQLGTTSTTALAGNTITITSSQALAINANSAKTSFPGFGTTAGTALEGNTSLFDGAYSSLTGVPSVFTPDTHTHAASDVTSGTFADARISESSVTQHQAALSITESQISDLGTYLTSVAFSDLTSTPTTIAGYGITDALQLGTTSTTALAGDTTTITSAQASAITANTAKTSFPGFGTTSGTALEGDTTLLQLGTTSTTALAGDTTTITSAQASAITANTAKTSFPGFGTTAGTALEGDTVIPDPLADANQTLTGNRDIDVDGNYFRIKNGSNIRLQYDPNDDRMEFTNGVQISGDLVTTGGGLAAGQVKLQEPAMGGSNGVILKAPSTNLSADVTFVLPDADGSSGQVIQTDGSGNLSFATVSGGGTQQTLEGESIDFVTRSTSYDQTAYEGEVVKIGSGSSMSFGQLRYMSAAGSPLAARWVNADADAESTSSGMLAIALGSNAQTDGMLVRGSIIYSNTFTPGDILYVSLTEGEITNDISSFTTGDIVRIVGYAMSTGQIYFNPSPNFIELA